MRVSAGLLGVVALALGCVVPSAPPERIAALPALADGAGRPALVVLVSVAGLSPDRYESAGAMPDLARLASQGIAAEDVAPVVGAGAYPAHASLVTGTTPGEHGIVADRLLGERGVRRAQPSHASQLRAATLWQRVAEAGGSVASLDWPTTTGAEIASLLPDLAPQRSGERWSALALGSATKWIGERVRTAPAEVDQPGPARDALLVELACAAFAQAPRLVLLRLRGPEAALVTTGPDSPESAAAFAAVDELLVRLLRCAEQAGVLAQSAFVVTGDRAFAPVHTVLRPNVWLSEAGWITAQGRWRAYARSNGVSAFVYADEARTALDARQLLEARAGESGAFQVVGAEAMIAAGADPDAWFGLQAEPGFAFDDAYGGAALAPAPELASAGALLGAAAAPTGLVAFGRGIRRGVRVPRMTQLDVAPTLAALLGVKLEAASGRSLVGLLRVSGSAADVGGSAPGEALPGAR
jgi:hypothetical protein